MAASFLLSYPEATWLPKHFPGNRAAAPGPEHAALSGPVPGLWTNVKALSRCWAKTGSENVTSTPGSGCAFSSLLYPVCWAIMFPHTLLIQENIEIQVGKHWASNERPTTSSFECSVGPSEEVLGKSLLSLCPQMSSSPQQGSLKDMSQNLSD